MKVALSRFILILINLLWFAPILTVHAQTWDWIFGQECSRHGIGDGLGDGFLCKTDVFNNIYVGGIFGGGNHGDSICFGAFEYYRPSISSNAAIVKYDSLGHVLWATVSDKGQTYPLSICTDRTGNLYLYGYFWSDSLMFGSHLIINPHYNPTIGLNPNKNASYYIVKFDQHGNILWHRTGGSVAFQGYSISIGSIANDARSNIYIDGSFSAHSMQIGKYTLVNARDSTCDIFAAKYDSSGNLLWAERFGGEDDDLGLGISASADGYCYLSGTFQSPDLSFGANTLHFSIGGAKGYYSPDIYIAKLDKKGKPIWSQGSDGSAVPYNSTIDRNNNLYISGTVMDTFKLSLGNYHFHNPFLYACGFMLKYDPFGTLLWGKLICPRHTPKNTNDRTILWGLTTDPCNNVWVGGRMNDTVMVDIATIAVDPNLRYGGDCLLACYDSSGNYLQSLTTTCGEDDNSGLSTDNSGNLYLSDDVGGNITLGTHKYSIGGGEGMYIAKLNPGRQCQNCIQPIVMLANDTIICTGDSMKLSCPESTGATYLWNTGSHASTISVSKKGTYWLTVTYKGCSATAYEMVDEKEKPAQLNFGSDTVLCKGIELQLSAHSNSALWSTGIIGKNITIQDSGLYWVFDTSGCGFINDTINVRYGECGAIGLPSAFSPNGDGYNDILYVRGAGIKDLDFKIYNRYGQLVFSTNSQKEGWDGTYNGQPQPVDAYGYVLKVSLVGDKDRVLKGAITLLR